MKIRTLIKLLLTSYVVLVACSSNANSDRETDKVVEITEDVSQELQQDILMTDQPTDNYSKIKLILKKELNTVEMKTNLYSIKQKKIEYKNKNPQRAVI